MPGNRRSLWIVVVLAVVLMPAIEAPCSDSGAAASQGSNGVAHIILDTDLSRWWDDATAVGMANVLAQQGKAQVLAVMSDIPNPVAVAAIDAIDTFYGHPNIPVGALPDSQANTAPHGYSNKLAEVLPHRIRSSRDVPVAAWVYRRVLAKQPNHSVTIVCIGSYANLAALLRSGPGEGSEASGRELLAEKVRATVIEDGIFPNTGAPAFTNQALDPAAAAHVLNGDWPTPIAWVDGSAGVNTKVGGTLCASVGPKNPMRIVYEFEFDCGPPEDGNWDGPTLLYAMQGTSNQFIRLGQGGSAYINASGGLSWRSDAGRPNDAYVHVADQGALNAEINTLLGKN
jgi:hypothetical protein